MNWHEKSYFIILNSGLTGALLTESQMTGKKSLSVLVFTEMMTVDSLSLTPFKIIHQIGEIPKKKLYSQSHLPRFFVTDSVKRSQLTDVDDIPNKLRQLKLSTCPDNIYMWSFLNLFPCRFIKMIEITVNDRLGKKVRIKCNEDDTIGDLKKLIAAQTGTRWLR